MAVYLCFVLSGVAALIYQSAWTRQFALVFGTTEIAVATVLAANMAGLALGAALVARRLPAITRPLRWYAALELGIAAAALFWVPACLWLANHWLIAWLGQQSALPDAGSGAVVAFNVVAAFLTLALPAGLMGATLPLLARQAVRATAQIGPRIGTLYAVNTAGAVVGALLACWSLLPALGLRRTLWVAAAVNLLVAGVAWALARGRSAGEIPVTAAAPLAADSSLTGRSPVVLWLMLAAGALSFAHEVLWTRLLGHVYGSSLSALGVMLACFLAGIAVGGAIGAVAARDVRWAARALAVALCGTGLAAIHGWYAMLQWIPQSMSVAARIGYGSLVLLPLTITSGATFPLAVRVLARGPAEAAGASARVYAWNTTGAIAGALLAAFWLLPSLRYEGAVRWLVAVALGLGVAAAWRLPARSWRLATMLTLAASIAGLLFRPQMPEAVLRHSSIGVRAGGALLHYDVGRSADVVVLEQGGDLLLRSNGLPEASVRRRGRPPVLAPEAWMAPLAVLARPQSRSMLVVGLGSGRMIEAVPPTVQSLDVIEIEPRMIDANRLIATARARDPLADPRLHLIVNDARAALSLGARRYDLILSQPSHPWTAGASHLYTREFMQQAREHLNPGGVFVQWMDTGFVDANLLRSLLATLNSVFTNLRVYRTAPATLLFLASDQPLTIEHDASQLQRALEAAAPQYAALGIDAPEDLLATLVLDAAGARAVAADAAPITDDDNRLATRAIVDRGRALSGRELAAMLAGHDPLLDVRAWPAESQRARWAFDYLGRRMLARARGTLQPAEARERVRALAMTLGDEPERVYLSALLARDLGDAAQAQRQLREALARSPDSDLLRFALLESSWGAVAYGRAGADLRGIADGLHGQAALVMAGARLEAGGRWQDLAALDASLAAIPVTAPWYAQSVLLRADWRALQSGARRKQDCAEAVALLERAMLLTADLRLDAARVWNLADVDRDADLLESIDDYAESVAAQKELLSPVELARAGTDLNAMSRLLQQIEPAGEVNAARIAVTQSALAHALERLPRA